MDDTVGDKMTDDDKKKKKKGVAIIIAVGPHSPKSPEHTMDSDDKPMKKAWAILKDDEQP